MRQTASAQALSDLQQGRSAAGHDAARAFVVTTAGAREAFWVDDAAFEKWWTAGGGEHLPDWSQYGSGAELADLFDEAQRGGVITGDAGIAVHVYGDDDEDGSGFFVVLNNRGDAERALGLTTGWQELLHLDDLSPRERCRAYLEEICTIANFVLAQLTVVPADRG